MTAEPRTAPSRHRGGLASVRAGPWTAESVTVTVAVGLLLVVGLVMSLSASFVDAAQGGDPFGIFRRQVAWAAVGVGAFVLSASADHRVWRPLSWLLLALATAGLVAVVMPGVGLTEGGATRWLAVGPVVFQPSEVAKLALLLWLADVLARKRERGIDLEDRPSHLLIPALPALGVLGTLVLLQPDLGTAILLALVVLLVLWVEGIPARHLAGITGATVVLGVVAAFAVDYRAARIHAWLDPAADPLGSGYQLLQSWYALGSGGLLGVGLGQGRGKWNFVPNPETDFVFAVIGEELGLVGALGVLGLYLALLVVGLRISRQAPTAFGRIVAFGVTGWIVGQALMNVSAVTGVLPITGVTLPLVSVGGSSLVVTLTALGILTSVGRAYERSRG
jgi:cell division protein FtsW